VSGPTGNVSDNGITNRPSWRVTATAATPAAKTRGAPPHPTAFIPL
jgi:hypothetical protein